MPLTNPLHLPEIRYVLGPYLSTQDLATCARVCRSWHASFTETLYASVNFTGKGSWAWASESSASCFSGTTVVDPAHALPPSMVAIQKHVHLIQHLSIFKSEGLRKVLGECTTLRSLRISRSNVHPSKTWAFHQSIVWLIRQNPHIKTFIHDWAAPPLEEQALKAVLTCPVLEHLQVNGASLVSQAHFDLFVKTCAQLRSLSLYDARMGTTLPWAVECQFPLLKELTMEFMTGITVLDQAWLIRNCPRLRSLRWSTFSSGALPIKVLCQEVLTTCPGLSELHLRNKGLEDEDWESILDTLYIVKKLTVVGWTQATRKTTPFYHGFGPMAFKSLGRHFQTLEVVEFKSCQGVTSRMIQTILESCPLLRQVEGDELFARDILAGSPWICSRLRSLHVCIRGISAQGGDLDTTTMATEQLQNAVMDQLAQLSVLEELILGKVNGPLMSDGPRLTLTAGLAKLNSLAWLHTVSATNMKLELVSEDIVWMANHWKRLEKFEGHLHTENEQRDRLKKMFWQLCHITVRSL